MKIFILLFLFSTTVYAAEDVLIQWTPPTARVDGTPLTIDEIDYYELYVDDIFSLSIQGNLTFINTTVEPGNKCFKMRTIDTIGRDGPFSAVSCKDIVSGPGAPTNIIIEYVIN